MPYIACIVTVLLLHQSSDQIITGRTHWVLAIGNITKQILVTKIKDDGEKIVYKIIFILKGREFGQSCISELVSADICCPISVIRIPSEVRILLV